MLLQLLWCILLPMYYFTESPWTRLCVRGAHLSNTCASVRLSLLLAPTNVSECLRLCTVVMMSLRNGALHDPGTPCHAQSDDSKCSTYHRCNERGVLCHDVWHYRLTLLLQLFAVLWTWSCSCSWPFFTLGPYSIRETGGCDVCRLLLALATLPNLVYGATCTVQASVSYNVLRYSTP